MADEYQSAYTGEQIDERLGKVPGLELTVRQLTDDMTGLTDEVDTAAKNAAAAALNANNAANAANSAASNANSAASSASSAASSATSAANSARSQAGAATSAASSANKAADTANTAAEAANSAASNANAAADEIRQAKETGEFNGSDANVTAENIQAALGYKPANEETVNQLSTQIGDLSSEKVSASEVFDKSKVVTPDYINQIPLSVDTDGSVFNETGYMMHKGITSSGELMDRTWTGVSGFIPVKKGDIIRVKEPTLSSFVTTEVFALYKADMAASAGMGKYVGTTLMADPTLFGSFTVNGNVATWDTSGITYWPWNDFAWLRITMCSTKTIVTVNEEITESVKDQLALKPAVKVTRGSLDFELSDRPLVGKKVVVFGDSLIGGSRDETSALAILANYTGAKVYNVGFSGCRMSVHPTAGFGAFCMWALAKAIAENDWTQQDAEVGSSGLDFFAEHLERLKSIDFSTVDMVVIHYGTNDYTAGNGGTTIDNPSDPDDYTTLCGALRYSIEALQTAYPRLQIYVSTPCYRYWTADDGTVTFAEEYVYYNRKLVEFVDALRNTAAEYHLPVIDNYHSLGLNRVNASSYLSDGVHQNEYGRRLFGEFIGGHLISKQASGKSGMDTAAVQSMIDAAIAAIPVYNGEVA